MPRAWATSWITVVFIFTALALLSGCALFGDKGADSSGLFGDLSRWGQLQEEPVE